MAEGFATIFNVFVGDNFRQFSPSNFPVEVFGIQFFVLIVVAVIGGVCGGLLVRLFGCSSTNEVAPPTTKRRIILVRHGESEANVDPRMYGEEGDLHIHLTTRGWDQAYAAGRVLRTIIGDEPVRFFVSPYVRARETLNGLANTFTPDGGDVSSLDWSEDVRLREHEKGFATQVTTPEEFLALREHSEMKYGRYFYRWPGGESLADVFDRVYSFRDTLRRCFRDNPAVSNYVVVGHGIFHMIFLQRILKHSAVDEYGQTKKLPNCAICILEQL